MFILAGFFGVNSPKLDQYCNGCYDRYTLILLGMNCSVLQVVSYLSPNWFDFYQSVVAFLGQALQVETNLVQRDFDPLNDPWLLEHQIDLAFICGLPLVRYDRLAPGRLRAIAAPVLQSPRYQNRPVYFSDVIVAAECAYPSLSDLVGTTVAYNDLGSNSGYYLLCYQLLQAQLPVPVFQRAIASGSHQQSIRWVAEGVVDCAAIDSVVLEQELQRFPHLQQKLRVIESIGPYPVPPLAGAQHLGDGLLQHIQTALLHPSPDLQQRMQQQGVSHYAAVTMAEYGAIAPVYDAVCQARYYL